MPDYVEKFSNNFLHIHVFPSISTVFGKIAFKMPELGQIVHFFLPQATYKSPL